MITIKIKTDNAAFGSSEPHKGSEVARILESIAARLHEGAPGKMFPLFDINGNRIGTFRDSGGGRR